VWWLASLAVAADGVPADAVVLDVGVHLDAGGLDGIATDGAAGQCTVSTARIVCPATSTVTFRWGRDDGYVLLDLAGQPVALDPGERAVALVLTPAQRAELDALVLGATSGDDPTARAAAVDGLHVWTWRSGTGPLQPTAPVPFGPGWLADRARDSAWQVRNAVIPLARDFRDDERKDEVASVLLGLSEDRNIRVRKAALAGLRGAVKDGMIPAMEAWNRCIDAAREHGSAGKAAATTLARLHPSLRDEPVDAALAVARTLDANPDTAWKVWSAWRVEVPFRSDWATKLITSTPGIDKKLVIHWSETSPDELAAIIRAWEPMEPHSDRFGVLRGYLVGVQAPAVRAALGLTDPPKDERR
jgi:hypothetical protein